MAPLPAQHPAMHPSTRGRTRLPRPFHNPHRARNRCSCTSTQCRPGPPLGMRGWWVPRVGAIRLRPIHRRPGPPLGKWGRWAPRVGAVRLRCTIYTSRGSRVGATRLRRTLYTRRRSRAAGYYYSMRPPRVSPSGARHPYPTGPAQRRQILSASCALPTPRHRPAAKEGSKQRRAEAPTKHHAREPVSSVNAAVVTNLAGEAPREP